MSAISQPMQNLKEVEIPTNRNSVVVIKISPENLSKCLTYFLSQQVAFEVNFQIEDGSQISEAATLPKNNTPTSQVYVERKGIAEEIYDKYIGHISERPLPEIPQIADEFGISVPKLKFIFKKAYGEPLYKTYMQARMVKSAELLKRGYRANVVSRMVGYADKSSIKFNKMFQKYFGTTPKKFQQQMAAESAKGV